MKRKIVRASALMCIMMLANNLLLGQNRNRKARIELLQIISPKVGDTILRDDGFEPLIFSLKNHGPDTIKPYDYILWRGSWSGGVDGTSNMYIGRYMFRGDVDTFKTFIRRRFVMPTTQVEACLTISFIKSANPADSLNVINGITSQQRKCNPIYYDNNFSTSTPDANNKIDAFSIYPNPANQCIAITASKEWKQFTIHDMKGLVMKSGKINSEVVSNQLDIQDLPDGQYVVSLHNEYQIQRLRFVKIKN